MVRMIFPFSQPFPQFEFPMHSGRPLTHFWHLWGSKCLTFGSPWFTFCPFGIFWFPFGSLWFPLAHFWYPWRDYENFMNFIHFHEFARLVNSFFDFSCFSRHISEEHTQQPPSHAYFAKFVAGEDRARNNLYEAVENDLLPPCYKEHPIVKDPVRPLQRPFGQWLFSLMGCPMPSTTAWLAFGT